LSFTVDPSTAEVSISAIDGVGNPYTVETLSGPPNCSFRLTSGHPPSRVLRVVITAQDGEDEMTQTVTFFCGSLGAAAARTPPELTLDKIPFPVRAGSPASRTLKVRALVMPNTAQVSAVVVDGWGNIYRGRALPPTGGGYLRTFAFHNIPVGSATVL